MVRTGSPPPCLFSALWLLLGLSGWLILLPPQLREVQSAYEGAKKLAHQLKRKCRHLTCDLEDTRVLLENQQSRNHELEKKQNK